MSTRGAVSAPFVIVTGLSGAGKSHALRALEDLGYFCVDNLPIRLIPAFADLYLKQRKGQRAAVVVDIREGRELKRFPAVFRRLRRVYGRRLRLVFLEAPDAVLMRRFSETRRPHPLRAAPSVAEGIERERRELLPMRRLADQVIDTGRLTVHDLRRQFLEAGSKSGRVAPLIINIVSFGFRKGPPADADLVLDVRFLPNPHFVPALRPWTGKHRKVARYVMTTKEARRFMALVRQLFDFLIPQYIAEGKSYLTIAIGCTGGRHRSVAIAEAFAGIIKPRKDIQVRIRHRDVEDT